jgi:hypothetical protein
MIEMLKAQIEDAHTQGLRFGFKVGFWFGMAAGAFVFLLVSMGLR